jgi:hypothetical protein
MHADASTPLLDRLFFFAPLAQLQTEQAQTQDMEEVLRGATGPLAWRLRGQLSARFWDIEVALDAVRQAEVHDTPPEWAAFLASF